MYADDIIIISENNTGLRQLLKICEKYGLEHEIKFNPKKTQYIVFGNDGSNADHIQMCGETVQRVDKIKYLGVWIDTKLRNTIQLEARRIKANGAFFGLKKVGIMSRNLDVHVKSLLFKSYSRPILYYGMENMVLNKAEAKHIQSLEGILVKRMLNVGKNSRTTQLLRSVKIETVVEKINIIKLSFYTRLISNEYTKQIVGQIIKDMEKFNELDKEKAKNGFIHNIVEELCGWNTSNTDDLSNHCIKKTKELKKQQKDSYNNGIAESLIYCMENRTRENDKILKLLLKSFDDNRIVSTSEPTEIIPAESMV